MTLVSSLALVEGKDTLVIAQSAEVWKQIDPLTLKVKFKKGPKFHKGNDFKTNDVVFSLTRAKETFALMSFFKDIDKIVALDNYTIQIATKQPFWTTYKLSCR